MRIILEVDDRDNGITTGTLWDLLDDLKATEQIKDYQIEPVESVIYTLGDALYYLHEGCDETAELSEEQIQELAEELNLAMKEEIPIIEPLWEQIRYVESDVAYDLLKKKHWLKEEKK